MCFTKIMIDNLPIVLIVFVVLFMIVGLFRGSTDKMFSNTRSSIKSIKGMDLPAPIFKPKYPKHMNPNDFSIGMCEHVFGLFFNLQHSKKSWKKKTPCFYSLIYFDLLFSMKVPTECYDHATFLSSHYKLHFPTTIYVSLVFSYYSFSYNIRNVITLSTRPYFKAPR